MQHPVDEYFVRYDKRPFELALDAAEALSRRYNVNLVEGAIQLAAGAAMVVASGSCHRATYHLNRLRDYLEKQIASIDAHQAMQKQKTRVRRVRSDLQSEK